MSSSQLDLPQDAQAESEPTTFLSTTKSKSGASSPSLPEIPAPDLDLSLSLDSILNSGNVEADKVQKRASNVMKLAQENEKLKAELQAMTDRLEAAERKRKELAKKESEEKAAVDSS